MRKGSRGLKIVASHFLGTGMVYLPNGAHKDRSGRSMEGFFKVNRCGALVKSGDCSTTVTSIREAVRTGG